MSEDQFPSLPEQFKRSTLLIADVIRDAITHNKLFVEPVEKSRRLSLCLGCEHFEQNSKGCKKCGCYMEHKAGLTAAQCPVKKW